MRLQLFACWLISLSCAQTNGTHSWKSEHRLLSFSYQDPWTLLPTIDAEGQTLTGVIDNSDGKSYVIKMTKDVSKDVVSDEKLFSNAKKTMFDANTSNRLLYEDDTVFHSKQAHRMIFFMNTTKWGPMKQVSYMSRNGKEFFSVQILYPINESEADKPMPEPLLNFDKLVQIDYK